MGLRLELDLGGCSGNAETCQTVQRTIDADAFCEAISDLDPDTQKNRELLAKLFMLCAGGVCPGQHKEQAEEILRSRHNSNE